MKKHKFSHRIETLRNAIKTLISFVIGIIFFVCSFVVQAKDIELIMQEEIPEAAPLTHQMSDEAIRYLQGEDMYQGIFLGKATKLLPNLITI